MFYYVYKITNNVNQKYYIGVHKHHSKFDPLYFGSGIQISRAIAKYGKENFTRTVLAYFDTHDEAYAHEKELVTEELVFSDECYNMNPGGKGGRYIKGTRVSKNKGGTLSVETRKKISDSLKGTYHLSEKAKIEHRERMMGNTYRKGKKDSEETRLKKSVSMKASTTIGKWERTPEIIAKMSSNRKGKGCGSSNAMSQPEAVEKIRQSKIGRKRINNPTGGFKYVRPDSEEWSILETAGWSGIK